MKNAGCQVFAVNHQSNRFTPKVPAFTRDLSLDDEVNATKQMLEFVESDVVHFGLMCSTRSRAREHQASKELQQQGAPTPQPLRDVSNLFGWPKLSFTDKIKEGKANAIYKHAITLLMACYLLSCVVSIEQQARGWLSQLLAILVKHTANEGFINGYFPLEATLFDACMDGSTRNKITTILGSSDAYNSFAMRCDHSHSHEPWRTKKLDGTGWVSDTAAEAEYPALFARRLAAGTFPKLETGPTFLNLEQLRLDRLQAQKRQHRELQQLTPALQTFRWLQPAAPLAHNEKSLPPKTAGDKVEVAEDGEVQSNGGGIKVGVWADPEAYIARALQLVHPTDSTIVLPDRLMKAWFTMVTKEPAVLARERVEALKLYRNRAADLSITEAELHKKLPVHVQGVAKSKHLLPFEERPKANLFPDMQAMRDFLEGVDLVGEEPFSELFREKLQPAAMTVDQLNLSAPLPKNFTIGRPLADHEREHAERLVALQRKLTIGRPLAGLRENTPRGWLSYLGKRWKKISFEVPFFSEEEVTSELGRPFWTLIE